MSDLREFTADEFADYWDSIGDDMEQGITFMSRNVMSQEGKELLADTATAIAIRHGVSSDKMKTFRVAMRKACKKAGLDDVLTPKKIAGTGTKKHPHPVMTIGVSKKQKNPTIADPVALCYNRMKKWVGKDNVSVADIYEAARTIYTQGV